MIYEIPSPALPWLYPVLAICGLAFQLAAIFFRPKWLPCLGLALVLAGAYLDRDITLAVGSTLATIGICLLK